MALTRRVGRDPQTLAFPLQCRIVASLVGHAVKLAHLAGKPRNAVEERLVILAPALLGLAFLLVLLVIYAVLCAIGRTPEVPGVDRRKFSEILGPFMTRYILWVIRPVERLFVVSGLSPNVITFVSLALCGASGWAIAEGHLASGAWLYALAGITDILDGRLARATGKQTKAGALFDSVSDRWGELGVFTGCAWYLRDSTWLLAVMLAIAGSMMVSYTRARGEGLGLSLDGGMMQRAERILVVGVGCMVAAWFAAAPSQADYASPALGAALIICGGLSALTAIGRLIEGYRILAAREAKAEPQVAVVEVKPREAANPMRITGEHTA
jgi:phosphatidylglycerophosphate synthase